ncbi:cupin domain-containing protein [Neobacillus drentensis]|uniref:cupin domain-containing protein n=1 Tax=Neobacillus drentensis TaxID=220684 RepID=UPI001F3825F7|nr:cupin domain-containing protein [Neobacillus drentensis]ULT56615.1 cupin domain-containing protein [Neobacillus drentensis]
MKNNQTGNTKSSNGKTTANTANLFFDSRKSVFFKRNAENIIFQVTSSQLPVLRNISLDNIFLSRGHILEPHWHPNAAELDYVVSGEAIISVLDPFTPQLLTYRVKPGDVVFIPINWWHWIISITEEAHVVALYDTKKRQNIFGSDVLRKTPPEVFQLAYGVNAEKLAKVLAPITETVVIGPKNGAPISDMIREMFLPMNRRRGGMQWGSTTSPELFFDVSDNVGFERNPQNVLYEVTSAQIPEMQDLALGDLFLSREHIREPHWHPNADELDFIISGEVIISILNPSTLELQTYHVKPGQVTFLPKGWWHWITCVTKEAHLLVAFNDGQIQSIEGSDVLRLTPPDVFELAYDVNAQKLAKVLSPIDETVVIGPPDPE